MNYVIENFQPTARYASASAIVNALQYYGAGVGIWNRDKPFIDMIDEANPLAIFTHGISEQEKAICDEKMIRVVNIPDIISYVPDALLFNPLLKHVAYKTECICLASYIDVDNIGSPELNVMMSTARAESFKFFTVAHHPKSYGEIPRSHYGAALATADSVLAISEVGKMNAILCNNNVRVGNTILDAIPEQRANCLEASNLFAAEEYLPIGTDITEMRNKVLREAFQCNI